MSKICNDYMVDSFNKSSKSYDIATVKVGLWASEKDLILKYFINKDEAILDMGCGAGRTSLGMEMLGYTNIVAVDFAPQMIECAINNSINSNIKYCVGNCVDLSYDDKMFSYVLFSFNGLMQIPDHNNRLRALQELYRVLKVGGIFIFTTHDRDNGNQKYLEMWDQEKVLWNKGLQDYRLHQFGDVITFDEVDNVEYYIHIPSYKEVELLLTEVGFKIEDSFIRSKRYKESKQVYDFSDNCRFWIVSKN